MRILRIDSWDGRSGGGQEYVRSVADVLAAAGHPQQLLSVVSDRSYHPRSDERIFPVAAGGLGRVVRDVRSDPDFVAWVRRAIAEFRPDLLHLHHFEAEFRGLARIVAETEVPVVATAHDASLVCPISTLILPDGRVCEGGVRLRCGFTGCAVGWGLAYNLAQTRRFDADVRPNVRAFLCPSRKLVDYLDVHGYRPAVYLPPFARIPDVVRVAPYPDPEVGSALRIGFIGRLERYKGVFDLVRALPTIARSVPNVLLSIAGAGPAEEPMLALARSLGVGDRIERVGHAEGAAKEAWFRSVSLVVVPSNAWENFGLVALEALTRGRPVVATQVGGLPDVVQDGESGRLVPVAQPDRLAAAVIDLLQDPVRARQLALEGRKRCLERFTPELHVQRLLAVYRTVLDGGSIPSRASAADLVAPEA